MSIKICSLCQLFPNTTRQLLLLLAKRSTRKIFRFSVGFHHALYPENTRQISAYSRCRCDYSVKPNRMKTSIKSQTTYTFILSSPVDPGTKKIANRIYKLKHGIGRFGLRISTIIRKRASELLKYTRQNVRVATPNLFGSAAMMSSHDVTTLIRTRRREVLAWSSLYTCTNTQG